MSLQNLKLTTHIIHPFLGVAFLDFVLLVVLLVMSVTIFASPAGVDVKFPLEAKEATAQSAALINITSENVIYFNGKVVTINDLRRLLSSANLYKREVVVKADRRAAMGRVGDVLDLCRGIPGVRVNVSASY